MDKFRKEVMEIKTSEPINKFYVNLRIGSMNMIDSRFSTHTTSIQNICNIHRALLFMYTDSVMI